MASAVQAPSKDRNARPQEQVPPSHARSTAAIYNKARAPYKHRQSSRHVNIESPRSSQGSNATGFHAGKSGCTSSPPAPVDALRTSYANTVSQRTHLFQPGSPKSPSTNASG